ncbi:MAG: thioredoxin family protein [Bacteroidales bacterium]|nr:thioredoxin family protein [Bacteroidales bacterium]
MKKILLIIGFALLYQFISAQDTLTIYFGPEYYPPNDRGIGYVIPRTYYTEGINANGKFYWITMSENFIADDTAWTLVFNQGWKNSAINRNTAILIGNYKSKKPFLCVDFNNNLDFSDDGSPLQFESDSSVIVYFRNSEVEGAYFPVKLYMENFNYENYDAITGFFGKPGPTIRGYSIVDVDFWLCEKRMNNKIAYTYINGKPLLIGLHDYDCNGLYNNKDKDRIMIGDYTSGRFGLNYFEGGLVYNDTVQLYLNGLVYEVLDIEQTGKYIQLVKSNKPYNKPLWIGDVVPDFTVYDKRAKKVSLHKLMEKDKYIVLDFSISGCKGCFYAADEIHAFKESHPDEAQIIEVNCNFYKKEIQAISYNEKMNWLHISASDELINAFNVSAYPFYILIDKKGKIVLMCNSFTEIKEYILAQ